MLCHHKLIFTKFMATTPMLKRQYVKESVDHALEHMILEIELRKTARSIMMGDLRPSNTEFEPSAENAA